jgi:hypothetical protein
LTTSFAGIGAPTVTALLAAGASEKVVISLIVGQYLIAFVTLVGYIGEDWLRAGKGLRSSDFVEAAAVAVAEAAAVGDSLVTTRIK